MIFDETPVDKEVKEEEEVVDDASKDEVVDDALKDESQKEDSVA